MEYEKNYGSVTSAEVAQVTMSKVYSWMTLALVVSTLSALFTSNSPALINLIFSSEIAFFGLIIVEFALVWFLSARIDKIEFGTGVVLFGLYSVLNGVTLSVVLLVCAQAQIVAAFLSTALTFGAMSLIGYTTKKDLSGIGSYLMMALIGLIIASLVNLFLHNTMMDTVITYLGILIFVGLTAYDTQKIKRALAMQNEYSIDVRKIALMGALNLYLDFVNLFLYILRLFGNRR